MTDTDVDTNAFEGVEEAVAGGLKNVEIGFVLLLVFVFVLVFVLHAFFPTVGVEVDRDPRAGPFLLAEKKKSEKKVGIRVWIIDRTLR